MNNNSESLKAMKKKNHESGMDDIPENRIEETVTLTWAAMLARKGKYPQAEALLRPIIGTTKASPDVLDLMAKIYAQQKKMEEARLLWLRAVQLNPDNTHLYRALIRCTQLLGHK